MAFSTLFLWDNPILAFGAIMEMHFCSCCENVIRLNFQWTNQANVEIKPTKTINENANQITLTLKIDTL